MEMIKVATTQKEMLEGMVLSTKEVCRGHCKSALV